VPPKENTMNDEFDESKIPQPLLEIFQERLDSLRADLFSEETMQELRDKACEILCELSQELFMRSHKRTSEDVMPAILHVNYMELGQHGIMPLLVDGNTEDIETGNYTAMFEMPPKGEIRQAVFAAIADKMTKEVGPHIPRVVAIATESWTMMAQIDEEIPDSIEGDKRSQEVIMVSAYSPGNFTDLWLAPITRDENDMATLGDFEKKDGMESVKMNLLLNILEHIRDASVRRVRKTRFDDEHDSALGDMLNNIFGGRIH